MSIGLAGSTDNMYSGARIKVVGIGGAGGNAVNTMIRSQLEGVEFIAANTDIQALKSSLAPITIQIGKELTKGLGAGADPDIGRDAALEDRHMLQEALAGSDMVFITAGMGGGTGTGGASVVAQLARELGILTVAVVTRPFEFEGKRRRRHADIGISRLRETVDTLITIPNQRLLQIATPELTMLDAFRIADQVLVNAVKGISDIINIPGTVNVDFADVKTVMSNMGMALMGIGSATGPERAVEAARQAISSPLLEDIDIEGATGILINVSASASVTLMEINQACSIVQDAAHEDANIIFGAVVDETLGEEMRVTVIATGFPGEDEDLARDHHTAHHSLGESKRLSRPGAYAAARPRTLMSSSLSASSAPPAQPSPGLAAPTRAATSPQAATPSSTNVVPPPPAVQKDPFKGGGFEPLLSLEKREPASSGSGFESLTDITLAGRSEASSDLLEGPAVLARDPAPDLPTNLDPWESLEDWRSQRLQGARAGEFEPNPSALTSLEDNVFSAPEGALDSQPTHSPSTTSSDEPSPDLPSSEEDLDIPAYLRARQPGVNPSDLDY